LQRPYIILNACDNTPGCPVIEACPQDIFHYNFNIKKLLLNQNQCLECGLCVSECEHDAVQLLEPDQIENKREQEDRYGMALAERIKDHYGIDPTSILNDKQIEEIEDIGEISDDTNILLYVYGIWQPESYIGYSFFKEISQEIRNEVNNLKTLKIEFRNIGREITELPAIIIIKDSKVQNTYAGIKNPMYLVPMILSEFN
jgi:NAD-dependent dihydropyrimidine dehydrogenase PreA subunit